MPIKTITPPETLTLTLDQIQNGETKTVEREYPFSEFVRKNLLALDHWGADYAAIKSAAAIDKALTKYDTCGDPIELAEEDWERLRATLTEPPRGLSLRPEAGRQLLPYMDAILDASTK